MLIEGVYTYLNNCIFTLMFFLKAQKNIIMVITLMFVMNHFYLFAQDSTVFKGSFEPSFNTCLGYLPKTYPAVAKSNYCFSTSVGFMWKLNGSDKWHQFYRFPKTGFELYFNGFGNRKEYGHSFGLLPTMELKGRNSKRNFFIKYGLGIAYFTKYYDKDTNPGNLYIGSPFTAMVSLKFFWKHRLFNHYDLTYGLGMFHFSNGHTQLPNAGANVFTSYLGIQLNKPHNQLSIPIDKIKTKLAYNIKFGLGRHEFGTTDKAIGGPKYNSYHFSGWVGKPFNEIHVLQVGFTAAYYESFYKYIVSQEVYTEKQKQKSITALVFLGHEFVFGNFGLSTQLGIYFYNPFFIKQKQIAGDWKNFGAKLQAYNTNRVGLVYYPLKKRNTLNNLKNQLSLGIYIKANTGQADLFEYCLGYTF